MTVLVSDSFNRANGALGVADTGQTWQTSTANFIVSGNKGSVSALDSTQYAYIDAGQSDVTVSVDFSQSSTLADCPKLLFRANDFTNGYVVHWNSSWQLSKMVAGNLTTLTSTTSVAGDSSTFTVTVKVVCSGSSISWYLNGTLISTITDATFNGTKHGWGSMRVQGFVDNFEVDSSSTGGTGTTLTVSLSDSITLSELLTKSPTKILSDAIATSETIFKQTSKKISDSMTLGEIFYKQTNRLFNDSLTITESLSKQGNLNKSDSINLSDALSKSLTVTVVDTVNLSENTSASQGGKSASLSDTILVTDAIVKKVISTLKTDAVSLADTDNHMAMENLFDSITLTDSITKSNGKSIILSDSITVTDAISRAVDVLKGETINLTDTTVKQAQIGVYDVLITADELNILNPNAPELISIIQLKGSQSLNVYLVGSQELEVELKGSQVINVNLKGSVMMAVTGQDFTMYQGETKSISVPVTLEVGTDLTGATINWALRQRMTSTSNLITKSTPSQITISGNTLTVHLVPSDTTSLKGSFYHECKMTDSFGNESELFNGSVTILVSNL